MSYGLKVLGGNNILQINSDLGLSGFHVVQSTAANNTTLPSYSELIFVRKQTDQVNICLQKNYTNQTVNFRRGDTGALITVDFIKARIGTELSNLTGSYGLRILRSNGTTVVFDSRAFVDTGITVIDSKAAFSLNSGSRVITSDRSNYVLMNWSYYINTSNFSGMTSNSTTGYTFVSRIGGNYYYVNGDEIAVASAFS